MPIVECRRKQKRDKKRRESKPEKERRSKEELPELLRLIKGALNKKETADDDEDSSSTDCSEQGYEKLTDSADIIESNKDNYYANTKALWELDKRLEEKKFDRETVKLLNEKMRRTIQYYLDTFLFADTSDPIKHLQSFTAKHPFIE